jgi:hypothetical protein
MASIWEKAVSILAGNLNSGLSYLNTTVPDYMAHETTKEFWKYDSCFPSEVSKFTTTDFETS